MSEGYILAAFRNAYIKDMNYNYNLTWLLKQNLIKLEFNSAYGPALGLYYPLLFIQTIHYYYNLLAQLFQLQSNNEGICKLLIKFQ